MVYLNREFVRSRGAANGIVLLFNNPEISCFDAHFSSEMKFRMRMSRSQYDESAPYLQTPWGYMVK
jgi:hypothetical protein